jgi:hypothetical protein
MRRTASPVGLSREGFEGLYGGRENGDEQMNWAEGVRYNHSYVDIYRSRNAGNDNRNLRATPSPERIRVGRGQFL